jgi:uncharacterized phage protein (TIGR02218 family)
MPYADLETSIADARPFRLYHFERGATHWAYTNADKDIRFQALDYEATPISDDGIRLTGETSADQLTVSLPASLPVVTQFRGAAPSDGVWLTIRDSHHGLPDQANSALVVWVGQIKAVRWTEPGAAEVICNSISASMGALGLRLCYERGCPHALYDHECRVDPTPLKFPVTLSTINGQTISVNEGLADIYSGGIIEWSTAWGTERRGIEAQNGSVMELLGGASGLVAGQAAVLYPGCDRLSQTCDERFGNILNFGGFRHMPGVSPFENNPFF